MFAFLSRDSFLYKRFHIPRSRVVFSFLLISFSFLILTLPFSFNLFSSFFENYVLTLLYADRLFLCYMFISFFFSSPTLFLSVIFLPFFSSFLPPSSFFTLFFKLIFYFYYFRSIFFHISRTDFLTTISLNSLSPSLLGVSVYFERIVITPATIASLHCLL